jgi:hypothetical protein
MTPACRRALELAALLEHEFLAAHPGAAPPPVALIRAGAYVTGPIPVTLASRETGRDLIDRYLRRTT